MVSTQNVNISKQTEQPTAFKPKRKAFMECMSPIVDEDAVMLTEVYSDTPLPAKLT